MPKKIQKTAPFSYLGYWVSEHTIIPQKVSIRYENLKPLNYFQKLLGDINWLCPALGIPTSSCKHHFETHKGGSVLSSPRKLTPQPKKEFDIVNIAIQNAQLNCIHYDYPIFFIVIASPEAPTGVLFQEQPTSGIIELLFLHSQKAKP